MAIPGAPIDERDAASAWARNDGDDPLRQRAARAYQRARRRLELADAVLGGVLTVVGALAAGWLARRLVVDGPLIISTAAFVVPLAAIAELVQLPLAVAGWRLSRRAGISRQRFGGWLVDRAKALGLAALIGVPVLTALIWLQRTLPDAWWLVAAGGAVFVEVVLATVAPVLILPLFLRSRPLPPGPLADDLLGLARSAGVNVSSVRVLEAGAKTSAANAFVTGFGPTRRIMLFDTLLGNDGHPDAAHTREARAVLGHELGHQRARDLWRFVGLGTVTTLVSFAFAAWLLGRLPQALVHGGAGSLAALPALVLGIGVAEVPLGVLSRTYSRRRERAADAFGVRLAGDGEAFARALERLCARNLGELEPPRLYVALRMGHPAPAERIAAARAPKTG